MNRPRLRIMVNIGPTFRVVDTMVQNRFTINHAQVINELLLNIGRREVNRHYNMINTQEPMFKDQVAIKLTADTLYSKLVHEAYILDDLAISICNGYIDCMYHFLINVHEIMSGQEVADLLGNSPTLYYSLVVEQYLGDGQFILAEMLPGQEYLEIDTSPWFYFK